MNVLILGKVRGFFKHLMNDINGEKLSFTSQNDTYEVASKLKVLVASLLRTKVIGALGIFKVVKYKNQNDKADMYLSFNRFVDSDKPYYIYLENPTALCNYSLTCLKSPFAKKKIRKLLANDNLKKIICMSKACENTLEEVVGVPVPKSKVCQIYPYVQANSLVSEKVIRKRCNEKCVKLLFIAQGDRFLSKGGLEVIEAFAMLKKGNDVSLTIITNIEKITEKVKSRIELEGIKLFDFKFSYEEMEKMYSTHHVLLQPSSDDSFGLTVLEAMKAGLAIIASEMYGFKEMVSDGVNGYLIDPAYRFFDENDIPNPKVWNNRKKTIYSGKINRQLTEDLIDAICKLVNEKVLLLDYSLASYNKANSDFGKEMIINKWNEL